MFGMTTVFDGVGVGAVDHIAIQTVSGMITVATSFFQRLGFIEDQNQRKSGNWGSACFMIKPGSLSIQLIDSVNPMVIPASENHIAIAVEDPEKVVDTIEIWALVIGVNVTVEEFPGEKFFVVTLPQILTVFIEFVPSN